MRTFLRVLVAFGIVLFFFYGTIFILDFYDAPPPNSLAQETKSLRMALQGYRRERGKYPILPDNPIGDIKKQLVSGGYLAGDQTEQDKDARYVSLDGNSYGLLFHINRGQDNPLGIPCLIEVDAKATGWWGQPPRCPF
jgi:hypothetical protein